MRPARRRLARRGLGVLAVVAALAAVRPWTVRPIAEAPRESFDPESYAERNWERLLGEAGTSAVDLTAALREHGAASGPNAGPPARSSRFVRGEGVVSSVDRRSRVGLLRLDVEGVTDSGVAIQIGPVLRGTAVRDASSFVSFTDFTNQSEFARVANALNDRVLRTVLAGLRFEALEGRVVEFTGAVTLGEGRPAIEIVPLTLRTAGAR